jgi:hypothetical protein
VADHDEGWVLDLDHRVDELLEEYRAHLIGTLHDLTEAEARERLVPSRTTLLGLVKHLAYVEGVWFDQAVTGRSARAAGVPASPHASFGLRADDTIDSVVRTYRERVEGSRARLAQLAPGDVVEGRGSRAVWALKLQVLRELAQHCGHADILREQLLARRGA